MRVSYILHIRADESKELRMREVITEFEQISEKNGIEFYIDHTYGVEDYEEDLDALHDEVVSGEHRRNQESSVEYSPNYDWSRHDFESDPDWR